MSDKVVNLQDAKNALNKKPAPGTEKVTWTGMTEEEAKQPGAALLAMLYQRANEDGLTLRELAAALDVTYGYIHQLKTGIRDVPQVSNEFVTNCARYLKKPKNHVKALAGKVSYEDDFIVDTLDGELDTALAVMYKDSAWGGYMPLSLKGLDRKERLFIIKLYEAATGKVLLPKMEFDAL